MKRKFSTEVYRKMGCPDLTNKMFFWKPDGTKIWGTVSSVEYTGFPGCKGGKFVRIGLSPFKNNKDGRNKN